MSIFAANHKKQNGVYYTPKNLAKLLVKPLRKKQYKDIFDPACGDGSLLRALYSSASVQRRTKLYGCDIDPNSITFDKAFFTHADFMKFDLGKKFDVIVMNPPYVRYHRLSKANRDTYAAFAKNTFNITIQSKPDLWFYFLLKSLLYLKKNGAVAAILPRSFLQADFAMPLRKLLMNKFEHVRVLSVGQGCFNETQERVILLWLFGFGEKAKKIEFSYISSLQESISYEEIEQESWIRGKGSLASVCEINDLLREYASKYDFTRFGDYADVKIGIVTGANKFFVVDSEHPLVKGAKGIETVPILTSCKEFHGLHFNGYKPDVLLLNFHSRLSRKGLDYIAFGEGRKYNLRAHALNRNPWYSLDIENLPDAFFPYRATYIPYLAFNDSWLRCTNSIHRIYFSSSITESQKRWIQLSLLSYIGQLSLEYYSKIYGSGVLKIEPGKLKEILVSKGKGKISNKDYAKVEDLVSKGRKLDAVKISTQIINEKLGISRTLASQTRRLYQKLSTQRKGK